MVGRPSWPSSRPCGRRGRRCRCRTTRDGAVRQVACPAGWSGRRAEQLEGDAVRVLERQARAVTGVDDLIVGHVQLVQPGRPLQQLLTIGTAEGDVVEAGPAGVEL